MSTIAPARVSTNRHQVFNSKKYKKLYDCQFIRYLYPPIQNKLLAILLFVVLLSKIIPILNYFGVVSYHKCIYRYLQLLQKSLSELQNRLQVGNQDEHNQILVKLQKWQQIFIISLPRNKIKYNTYKYGVLFNHQQHQPKIYQKYQQQHSFQLKITYNLQTITLLSTQLMNKNLTVLITGTSKGLGYDLVKLFLNNNPNSTIVATSRQDPKDAYTRWQELDKRKQINCKKLQILSKESIEQFAKQIQQEHVKFDIVVNNAGVASIKDNHDLMPDLQLAKQILNTNTIGTIQLTKSILPFVSQSCRIINVSSLLGALKFHPEHTQKRFSDPNITEEDIINGVHEYLKENEQRNIKNWSLGAYNTSKMLLNAWSRFILQKKWLSGNQKAICVAPGFCRTPMTKDFPSSPWEYSSESGAIRIYETIFLENLDPEIFYHRARKSDYFRCGEGLPYDPIK